MLPNKFNCVDSSTQKDPPWLNNACIPGKLNICLVSNQCCRIKGAIIDSIVIKSEDVIKQYIVAK